MKKKYRNKLKRLRNVYCYGEFFLNRGLGLLNPLYQIAKYTAFAGIIVGMINEAIGYTYISMDKVFYFIPIVVIALMITGIIDVRKIHTLQKSNEIQTKYNPYLVNLITKSKHEK